MLSHRRLDEVELHEYDIADPFAAIRAGHIDVMIAKFALREPDLVAGRTLCLEPRGVVVRRGHPLAGRPSVSIEDLADFDAFAPPGQMPSYVWDHVVPTRTPTGRTIRRTHRVATVPEMMERVAGSDAVHISLASLADVAPPSVQVLPVHDLPPAPVLFAWRRDPRLDQVRAFVADAAAVAAP
jgi:DNA-binding transcriptional LysR family regulator